MPSAGPSTTETRMPMMASGAAARTASMTRFMKRSGAANSSVRWLEIGDMNWWIR